MLHNLITKYRDYLLDHFTASTARVYAERLTILLEGQSVTDTIGKLDIDKVIEKLAEIKYKNYFSQSKNALLHFCAFQNIILPDEALERIKQLEEQTRKKYRKLKIVEYKTVDKKIKHLKNAKLKLSYQTIMATGLRVSELAQIRRPSDCTVTDNEITMCFIAKGGNTEKVTLCKNENSLLFEKLKEQIKRTKPTDKLFYSAIYLQTRAKELGFTCHDLRRIFAKLEYKKCRNKEEVKEKMRHSSMKNTNIYLKINVKL
jgi:integrase